MNVFACVLMINFPNMRALLISRDVVFVCLCLNESIVGLNQKTLEALLNPSLLLSQMGIDIVRFACEVRAPCKLLNSHNW